MTSENSKNPQDSQKSLDNSGDTPHSLPPDYVYTPNKPLSEEPSKLFSSEVPDLTIIVEKAAEEEKKRTPQNEKTQEKGKTSATKSQQTINFPNLKGDIRNYMKTNREQIIIYILLALGLILLLFSSNLMGALIIGMVAGYYFSSEIIYFIRNLGQMIGGKDQLHYVVLATIALALFIEAPGIFIGAIIVATFKQVLTGPQG